MAIRRRRDVTMIFDSDDLNSKLFLDYLVASDYRLNDKKGKAGAATAQTPLNRYGISSTFSKFSFVQMDFGSRRDIIRKQKSKIASGS